MWTDHDTTGLSNTHILVLRCPPCLPACCPTRFVISYHLLDQTLSVWEPPQANSGMKGGTFLERTKVKKEGGGGAVGSLADIGGGRDNLYTDADMEVGASGLKSEQCKGRRWFWLNLACWRGETVRSVHLWAKFE